MAPLSDVSLTMIVRDEERNLEDCLRCVEGLFGEAVIVDTGSTDRTREIAASFGAKVIDFPWQDSFSAARNESLRHANGKWAFWLDADDRIDEENRRKLQDALASLGETGLGLRMLHRLHHWSSDRTWSVEQVRLFQRAFCHWQYRVHEQVMVGAEFAHKSAKLTDIAIDHLGYLDKEVVRSKDERNLALCRMDLRERPSDPRVLFSLGWTQLALGDNADAAVFLERVLQFPVAEARPYGLLAQAYARLGERGKALAVCQTGRQRFPADVSLVQMERRLSAAGPLVERARPQ